jgi:hypothetical protein
MNKPDADFDCERYRRLLAEATDETKRLALIDLPVNEKAKTAPARGSRDRDRWLRRRCKGLIPPSSDIRAERSRRFKCPGESLVCPPRRRAQPKRDIAGRQLSLTGVRCDIAE